MTAEAARNDTQAPGRAGRWRPPASCGGCGQPVDWQREMRRASSKRSAARIDCQRGILFRLRELPGQGFAQSVAAYWVDAAIGGHLGAADGHHAVDRQFGPAAGAARGGERQGKIFAGHTRELEGFLRNDFERQNIKSFLSVAVFAHGHAVGYARGQRLRQRARVDGRRKGGDGDHRAGARRRHRTLAVRRPCQRSHPPRPCCRPRSTPSSSSTRPAGSSNSIRPPKKCTACQRGDILGKDLLDTVVPEYYRKGYANGAEYMAGPRRADGRPAALRP